MLSGSDNNDGDHDDHNDHDHDQHHHGKEDDDDGPPEGDTIIISLVEIESDWREHWNIA